MQDNLKNTDDFLFSDDFHEYVLGEDPSKQKKLDEYLKKNPGVQSHASTAKKIIVGLNSLEDRTSIDEINEVLLHNRFEDAWNSYRGEKSKKVILKASAIVKKSLAVAAILVFILVTYPLINNYLNNHKTPGYFEMYVPSAKQSKLALPDGSQVWVNSETKIKYSNLFNIRERNIYLTGEAYFEVAKNEKLPFNVFVNGVQVKVTGTKFNAKSYVGDNRVETVLLEGKVQLSRAGLEKSGYVEMQPGDKATFDLNTNKVLFSRKNVDADVAWKDGKTIFRNTPLADVCMTLTRKYGSEVLLEGDTVQLLQHPFTFTVVNETLPQVLDYLCHAAPLKYSVNYIDDDGEKGIEKIVYTISSK